MHTKLKLSKDLRMTYRPLDRAAGDEITRNTNIKAVKQWQIEFSCKKSFFLPREDAGSKEKMKGIIFKCFFTSVALLLHYVAQWFFSLRSGTVVGS